MHDFVKDDRRIREQRRAEKVGAFFLRYGSRPPDGSGVRILLDEKVNGAPPLR